MKKKKLKRTYKNKSLKEISLSIGKTKFKHQKKFHIRNKIETS